MDQRDPFLIHGPAVVSFSGGRTSAYMLHRILQAHGGTLPDDVVVCFANTGREMPATLDFVRDCGAAWNAPIVWLEFAHGYVDGKRRRHRWAEVVSHNSASRNGEPFDRLLESKRIVPDRSRRFCSEQLKVNTIRRHLTQVLGWTRWLNVVGFRADEGRRIDDKRAYEAAHPEPFISAFPLADAGVQEFEILAAWRGGSFGFDLRLDTDGDGGNCDGCFLFSPGGKLVLLWHDARALFIWRRFISGDGQQGINCAVFRNEGASRSSDLIREADAIADERWPGERHYTYVNPRKIRSANPGYCFLMAGWRRCGVTKHNRLVILERVT